MIKPNVLIDNRCLTIYNDSNHLHGDDEIG